MYKDLHLGPSKDDWTRGMEIVGAHMPTLVGIWFNITPTLCPIVNRRRLHDEDVFCVHEFLRLVKFLPKPKIWKH